MPERWTTIGLVAALLLAFVLLVPAGMLWMLRHPPRAGGTTTPSELGLAADHRRLTTSDGLELDAWIVHARDETDSAIVAAHGYPADKADILPAIAPLAEDHHLVLFDHRGLGQSEGTTTLGVREERDVEAAIEAADAIEGVEHVGLLGFSMGGAAVLQAAADEPRVEAVLAQAAYADLASLAPSAFAGMGPLAQPLGWLLLIYAGWIGLDPGDARPIEAAGDVRAPVFYVHGSQDETIDPEQSRRLADATPEAQLWIVDGAGHGAAAMHPAWDERVTSFFDEAMKRG